MGKGEKRESVVVSTRMQGERAVRLLLWGRESVVVGTCMLGERTVRVVVGMGAAALSGGREPSDMQSDRIRHALRRTQMQSDVLRCNQTYSDALRRDDQTHLERRRSRVGEQRERESLDGGT